MLRDMGFNQYLQFLSNQTNRHGIIRMEAKSLIYFIRLFKHFTYVFLIQL